MKRITSLILLASLLTGILASCGSQDNPPPVDSSSTGTTEPAIVYPDFGGRDINILMRTDWEYEFNVEEENGDLVNDAIYKRNTTVEDNYNVNINSIAIAGGWDQRDQFNNTVTSSVLSGDGAYDVVSGYQAYIITPAMEGMFMNIYEIPEIDVTNPWWSELAATSLTQNGICYMITGDIALSLWKGLYCMYFNKKLATDYQIEDLYALVKSGKWTVDKLAEISANVSRISTATRSLMKTTSTAW